MMDENQYGGVVAHIAGDGAIIAFYEEGVGVSPPASVETGRLVVVSSETRNAWCADPSQRWVDGALVAYAPPPRTPEQVLAAMPPVSHAQIIAALILAGIITEAEGVAWISGTLPDAVEAMIATLPADQQVIARLRAIRPSSVVPTDPLVAALAAAQGQGVADLIALFETAAAL